MRVASTNDPRAPSPKGAIGLMQIMPATWREPRARYGLGADPYDPRDNILAARPICARCTIASRSPDFLAAYNAGPERYAQHLATGQALLGETQSYVAMLAPIIDGSQPERTSVVPGNVPNWRSLLFATSIGRRPNAPRSASSLLPTPALRDTMIVDLSALVPPSNGLFVRRSDEERVR